MAIGWYGLEIGNRVKYQAPSAIKYIEGEIIHLYDSDKNRARIKLKDGTEKDVVCEYCEKV